MERRGSPAGHQAMPGDRREDGKMAGEQRDLVALSPHDEMKLFSRYTTNPSPDNVNI